MNVVDSSAWIEFFNGGLNARFFGEWSLLFVIEARMMKAITLRQE